MTESPSGEAASTDATPDDDAADAGDEDIVLTTDDAAQRDNDVAQPGND